MKSLCQAFLQIVNNVANSTPINVSIDESSIATDVSFGNPTEFIGVQVGSHVITVSFDNIELSISAKLKKGKYYTLVFTGLLSNLTQFPFQLILLKDNRKCHGCKAQIRFVNLAAGSPHVDVYVDGKLVFRNVSFNSLKSCKWLLVCPGIHTIQVNLAGTSTVLVQSVTHYFSSQQVFTIILSGTDSTSFTIQILWAPCKH